MKEREIDQKKEGPEVKTFSVPFPLGESKENIFISTNTASQSSKEQIIQKGIQAHLQGDIKEASRYYQYCISQGFKDHRVFSNFGVIHTALGKAKEAQIFFRKAIEIKPDFEDAYLNLGNLLRDQREFEEAEFFTRKAIEIKPDFAEAYNILGNILRDLDRLEEAEKSIKKAIKLDSKSAIFYSNLGNILIDRGEFNEAAKYYKEAINFNESMAKAKQGLISCKSLICDWSEVEIQTDWLKTLGIDGDPVLPFGLIYIEDDPIKQLKRSLNFYNKKYYKKIKTIEKVRTKKIHLGYFSADFRNHATTYLISEVLRLHNKLEFEIYLYSFPPIEDEYTKMIKDYGCIFRDIKNLNNSEAVQLARKDNLDIAIDLMGYVKNNRMEIFSNRVAPIQINYLGYPGSLGAKCIDYIIADKVVIPDRYESFYSEKVVRMPHCYQCNSDQKEICNKPILRQNFNLPKKGFVFVCFNANNKITNKEFDIWMRLLKKVNGSVLWLYKSNKWSEENLFKEAKNRDVDPNKLIFADYLPLKQHLARYSLGNLGLDTFNFNGHTTTSDALWAGLPVLTKIGESFAARVSASLLTSIGLTELITYSEKEYENKALYIAKNPGVLIKLKSKLAQLRESSPLYNSELFTRDLENKYKEISKSSSFLI